MKKFATFMLISLALASACPLSGSAAEPPVSQDLELELGKWTDMAKRYPMPYFASPEVPDAPAPEVLARW